MVVVPVEEQFQFPHHGTAPKGNQDEPRTLNLHSLDESLQDGDTSVLADRPDALREARHEGYLAAFLALLHSGIVDLAVGTRPRERGLVSLSLSGGRGENETESVL